MVTNREEAAALDNRVLVLAPTGKDASLTQALLSQAGLTCRPCERFEELLDEVTRGAAAILIPEEILIPANNAALRQVLDLQPTWSDLPILVLARTGVDSVPAQEAVRTLGNVTLLERPIRTATLLSAIRTAVRARGRQYQIRGHLEERIRAEELLRVADRRKDEFLATLGHELRNPLAPLLTGVQLLKRGGADEATARHVTAVMERQIRQLSRLVDDLLEVSRITRGLIEIRREPIDLGVVLRSAIETSRPSIDDGGHELTVDIAEDPLTVSGDPVRLTQVFSNLLTNAAKYTNPGGHVWLSAMREGSEAVVSVRDTGIGIPPDQLGSVFEMFSQVDRTTKRSQGGLGIGLTLVRSLVEMHGGRVEARSAGLGRGSEFLVRLPVAAERREITSAAEAPVEFPPRRILIVDDNRDAADTLAALLTDAGATVAVAYGGRPALDAVASLDPDAVLLDLGMPDMDGYEVARAIRASNRPDLLLIALTGWGQEHDRRRTRSAGFDHHLVKPPDLTILRDILTSSPRIRSKA